MRIRAKGNQTRVIMLMLAASAALVGLGLVYTLFIKEPPKVQTTATNGDTPPEIVESESVKVPVAKGGGPDGTFETSEVKPQRGVDPVVVAVNAFLRDSLIAPSDAKLVSVKKSGSQIELAFNRAFRRTYGTDDEITLVRGIMRAVASNSRADSVLFMEGGHPIGTLGSIELEGAQNVADWVN